MWDSLRTISGAVIVAAAVGAILRGFEVRLIMLVAAILMTTLAGEPTAFVRTFLGTLSDEQFVLPICSAMGFAYVLRESGCDRHLVLLLTRPARRWRAFVIPASIAAAFFVNVAVISQTSTAVAVGTVLIPILRSTGLNAATIGALLLLGASVGGELLNPGAPELQSVARHLGIEPMRIQPFIAKLLAIQVPVASIAFWLLTLREKKVEDDTSTDKTDERIDLKKAIVPLVPLILLTVIGPPFNIWAVPDDWLVDPAKGGKAASRLIGAAMLIGTVLAVVAAPSGIRTAAKSFFEGVGYAMTHIVSLIVCANCFGQGIKSLRLADWVGGVTKSWPGIVWLLAAGLCMGFAMICGSGMATTESLYRFFVPANEPTDRNLAVGALVSIASAAGRTASPAAAVVLLCATLLNVSPSELLRRVLPPLLVATTATTIVAWLVYN